MPLPSENERWGGLSITVHWATFLLVAGMAAVGLYMVDLPNGTDKLQLYSLHKSFGLTVLGLTALRLLGRALVTVPTPVEGTPAWQHRLARTTHGALYALLVAVPLSGWWFNSAAGFPLRWFGLVALPKLASFDRELKAIAKETHEILFYALAGVVLIHALAALWHHYHLKDRTLVRMWYPSRRTP